MIFEKLFAIGSQGLSDPQMRCLSFDEPLGKLAQSNEGMQAGDAETSSREDLKTGIESVVERPTCCGDDAVGDGVEDDGCPP